MRAQLGDHRVVEHRDIAAFLDARIHADHTALLLARFRLSVVNEPADGRQEVAVRVFGVDPAFHCPAMEPDFSLRMAEPLARRHADHLLDNVDAGDEFGHGVLDLQPGVHFQEVEVALGINNEFHRSSAHIIDRAGQRHGLRPHFLAGLRVEERAGRLLDHLLVAPLDRAFTLTQMHDVAVLVREDLDLDVARPLDELLDKHAVVAEAGPGLRHRRHEALRDLASAVAHAHPLAAAARRRLDDDRKADFRRDPPGLVRVLDDRHDTRHRVNARLGGELLRLDLVAHHLDGPDVWPDEGDACLLQSPREVRIFRQETKAGMDRLGSGVPRR